MTASASDLSPIQWSKWADNPYPLYKVLRDQGPIFHDAPNNAYLVTRYDEVFQVLADVERFSNIPANLLDTAPNDRISTLRNADPPRHTWIRAIVMPLFTSREMRRLDPYFKQLSAELLDKVEEGDTVEVSSQIAIPLPGRVTCDLLGVPDEKKARFLDLTAERLRLMNVQTRSGDSYATGPSGLLPTDRTFLEVRNELWETIEPIMAARRQKPEHDAITLLAQAQDKVGTDQLPNEIIIDLLLQLLTGGFHTTQHLLEMFIDLLADRDDIWQRLRADPSLIPAAIEEMLRLDPPVQALPRRAREDMELFGMQIPKNANLMMVYGAANHDERVFADPETYSLDREGKRHTSFSAGIHICPGAPVSRFEVKALLEEMAIRYKRIERAGPTRIRATGQTTVNAMHGREHVPVRFVRA